MDKVLFITALASYLVSLAASLLLSFFYKKINIAFLILGGSIHLVLLVLFFLFGGMQTSIASPDSANYFLLAYFCSGIIMAGTVLRKRLPLITKIYAAVFLSSALLFFFNPSLVIGIITTGSPNAISPHKYRLYDNVYLMEQQNSFNNTRDSHTFKITKELGVFHKTLARNIGLPDFPEKIESVKLAAETGVRLKMYFPGSISPRLIDTVFYYGTISDSSREITRQINHP